MCVSVHIFEKAFCPIILRQISGVWSNFYNGLPLSTACLMQNGSSRIPILFAKNVPKCAWVRPSSPYYRVRMVEIWPGVFSKRMHFFYCIYSFVWSLVKPSQVISSITSCLNHKLRPKRKIFLSLVSIRVFILGSDGQGKKFFMQKFFLF